MRRNASMAFCSLCAFNASTRCCCRCIAAFNACNLRHSSRSASALLPPLRLLMLLLALLMVLILLARLEAVLLDLVLAFVTRCHAVKPSSTAALRLLWRPQLTTEVPPHINRRDFVSCTSWQTNQVVAK